MSWARELAASRSPEEPYYFNPEDKGWWDLYMGQETVIIHDFRGSQLMRRFEILLMHIREFSRESSPLTTSLNKILNCITLTGELLLLFRIWYSRGRNGRR